MTFRAFSFNEITDVAFLEDKQTFRQCIEALDIYLLPFSETLGCGTFLHEED